MIQDVVGAICVDREVVDRGTVLFINGAMTIKTIPTAATDATERNVKA